MNYQLSILIPVKNCVCTALIESLYAQAMLIENLKFEILVADDGSTIPQVIKQNEQINALPYVHYIVRNFNVGRSAIRNFLTQKAQYTLLLFLDCDVCIDNKHFLESYLKASILAPVVYGGIKNTEEKYKWRGNLRYKYEKHSEKAHRVELRKQAPYKCFRTTNFLVAKQIMQKIPFDEAINTYGYEDVLFGKELEMQGIAIEHIANEVLISHFENNHSYFSKLREALFTLAKHQEKLDNYAPLLRLYKFIKHIKLTFFVQKVFCLLQEKCELHLLYHHNPKLWVLKFYKIGYFISIQKFL